MTDQPAISFEILLPEELDQVRPVWEQLSAHHAILRTPFVEESAARRFEDSARELSEKAGAGGLRIEIARATEGGQPVAYCITTLSADRVGKIDSLFVAPQYRRHGIASTLMQRALDWLSEAGAESERVLVLKANEEALAFYRRFGFQPRNVELQRVPGNP